SLHLDNQERLKTAENNLLEEKQIAGLREEFIAILGHDLRNPVSAITSSVQVMNMLPLDDKLKKISSIIQNSSHRISGLIHNMLAIVRGRMVVRILVSMCYYNLEHTLKEVISEMKSVGPESNFEVDIEIPTTVSCDANRIGQLFSNL